MGINSGSSLIDTPPSSDLSTRYKIETILKGELVTLQSLLCFSSTLLEWLAQFRTCSVLVYYYTNVICRIFLAFLKVKEHSFLSLMNSKDRAKLKKCFLVGSTSRSIVEKFHSKVHNNKTSTTYLTTMRLMNPIVISCEGFLREFWDILIF